MRPYWKEVVKFYNEYVPKRSVTTITFDSRARVNHDVCLTNELSNHGGGTTDIHGAFKTVDREIAKFSCTELTILFISDGQDNTAGGVRTLQERLQTLQGNRGLSVTFLCLGIQKNFPTFISMQIRELYHNTQVRQCSSSSINRKGCSVSALECGPT